MIFSDIPKYWPISDRENSRLCMRAEFSFYDAVGWKMKITNSRMVCYIVQILVTCNLVQPSVFFIIRWYAWNVLDPIGPVRNLEKYIRIDYNICYFHRFPYMIFPAPLPNIV